MRKFWIGIVGIILISIVIFLILVYPSISFHQNLVLGEFFKVSNKDYAPKGKIVIWYVTWVGCPVGAADSWILYSFLHNNNVYVNITLHYSDPNDKIAHLPGILFSNGIPNTYVPYNYSSGNVIFSVCYMMNEYFNETPNGIPVLPNNILNTELNELKDVLPQWVYSLVYYYNVKASFNINGKTIPPAYYVSPHHIISTIVISGKGGTWIMVGPMYNLTVLKGLTYEYVMNNLQNFSWYKTSYQEFSETVDRAQQ